MARRDEASPVALEYYIHLQSIPTLMTIDDVVSAVRKLEAANVKPGDDGYYELHVPPGVTVKIKVASAKRQRRAPRGK